MTDPVTKPLRETYRKYRSRTIKTLLRTKHRLIKPSHHFIHIPRSGGTSIRRTLRFWISLSDPYHYRYVDVVDNLNLGVRCFCVIRNPWSRTASRYVYSRKTAKQWPQDCPRKKYIESVDFDQYVRDMMLFEIPQHPGMPWMGPMTSWFNQLYWIIDSSGKVVCDCLRLEHLNEDLGIYLGAQVPKINASSADYRKMFTDETVELVAHKFADDIEYFGFSFNGCATRNTIRT